ncbi:hypothetical protein ACFE04_024627 [Oxalis oulophora]
MGRKQKQKQKNKNKIVLPPELPPELADEEIEFSDEDVDFVETNPDYTHYFVDKIDTEAITKEVKRVAGAEEDTWEAAHLERKKRQAEREKNDIKKQAQLQHPADALPVKTLDGKLFFPTEHIKSKFSKDEEDNEEDGKDKQLDKSLVRLTKAEKRAKEKKMRKDAKKQGKDYVKTDQPNEETPQAAVLAEVQEDLTAEEAFENKMRKLAELGTALLADPESNIRSLKDLLQLSRDNDSSIVRLALRSLLAVFKDIIPGYRIRLPTEKELEMKVSKDIKKMRFYESTLLSAYKAYLQKLVISEKQPTFQHVVIRCICNLLEAAPHFNFRESLLSVVVKNIGSHDDIIRKLCCDTIKSLFTNEGKHGGEATIEAVRLIADLVKANQCQLHPESIEVFMSLSFDENLGKPEEPEDPKLKYKKNKKRKDNEDPNKLPENDRKKNKKMLMSKMKQEVDADYKSASFTPDVRERRSMQSETLSAVFETYFRILKQTMHSIKTSSEANTNAVAVASVPHPLLDPCLNGLGKFCHLIDMDFINDLMNYLKKLAAAGNNPLNASEKGHNYLTVSERIRCCIVAFKVMKSNLDALNVDLQDFFVQLYNVILEYRPGRDQGEVLAEALKIMLCDDRQHDMQKAAAFVKRLATFSLCFGSAESMAALVTLRQLLQKNMKVRNLLENDAGGGSVSGSVAKYQPYGTDPNQSGALASVLWELNLLSKHYHPSISTMATTISTMTTAQTQVFFANITPQQAFLDLSLNLESFEPKGNFQKLNKKRKVRTISESDEAIDTPMDVDGVSKKFSEHFEVLRGIKENETLRRELDRTNVSLQLFEEYKKQKKSVGKPKSKKSKV